MDPHAQQHGRPWRAVPRFGSLHVRQFEFHPFVDTARFLAAGTISGCAVVADHVAGRVVGVQQKAGASATDPVLALCWLRSQPGRFVTGSSHGAVRLLDASAALAAYAAPDDDGEDGEGLGSIVEADAHYAGSLSPPAPVLPVVHTYARFDKLTCVHLNCDDSLLACSGYNTGLQLTDAATGQRVRTLTGLHDAHINIARFPHAASPYLLATCSFDGTVRLWDLRQQPQGPQPGSAAAPPGPPAPHPLYTVRSDSGHVTLSWSPDDTRLLTCAVDNEVRQYRGADGLPLGRLDMPRTHSLNNYTRAYYVDGGAAVASGASEEGVLRLHCASTGEQLAAGPLLDGRTGNGLYVQSLRGSPAEPGLLGVIATYRDINQGMHYVSVDTAAAVASGRSKVVGRGGAAPLQADATAGTDDGMDVDNATPTLSPLSPVGNGEKEVAPEPPARQRHPRRTAADTGRVWAPWPPAGYGADNNASQARPRLQHASGHTPSATWYGSQWRLLGDACADGAAALGAVAASAAAAGKSLTALQAGLHARYRAVVSLSDDGASFDVTTAPPSLACSPTLGGSGADVTLLSSPVTLSAAAAAATCTPAAVVAAASGHRALLAARVPLFRALFAHAAGGADSLPGPLLVSLPAALQLTPPVLSVLLTYAYTDVYVPPVFPACTPAELAGADDSDSGDDGSLIARFVGVSEEASARAAALAAALAVAPGAAASQAPTDCTESAAAALTACFRRLASSAPAHLRCSNSVAEGAAAAALAAQSHGGSPAAWSAPAPGVNAAAHVVSSLGPLVVDPAAVAAGLVAMPSSSTPAPLPLPGFAGGGSGGYSSAATSAASSSAFKLSAYSAGSPHHGGATAGSSSSAGLPPLATSLFAIDPFRPHKGADGWDTASVLTAVGDAHKPPSPDPSLTGTERARAVAALLSARSPSSTRAAGDVVLPDYERDWAGRPTAAAASAAASSGLSPDSPSSRDSTASAPAPRWAWLQFQSGLDVPSNPKAAIADAPYDAPLAALVSGLAAARLGRVPRLAHLVVNRLLVGRHGAATAGVRGWAAGLTCANLLPVLRTALAFGATWPGVDVDARFDVGGRDGGDDPDGLAAAAAAAAAAAVMRRLLASDVRWPPSPEHLLPTEGVMTRLLRAVEGASSAPPAPPRGDAAAEPAVLGAANAPTAGAATVLLVCCASFAVSHFRQLTDAGVWGAAEALVVGVEVEGTATSGLGGGMKRPLSVGSTDGNGTPLATSQPTAPPAAAAGFDRDDSVLTLKRARTGGSPPTVRVISATSAAAPAAAGAGDGGGGGGAPSPSAASPPPVPVTGLASAAPRSLLSVLRTLHRRCLSPLPPDSARWRHLLNRGAAMVGSAAYAVSASAPIPQPRAGDDASATGIAGGGGEVAGMPVQALRGLCGVGSHLSPNLAAAAALSGGPRPFTSVVEALLRATPPELQAALLAEVSGMQFSPAPLSPPPLLVHRPLLARQWILPMYAHTATLVAGPVRHAAASMATTTSLSLLLLGGSSCSRTPTLDALPRLSCGDVTVVGGAGPASAAAVVVDSGTVDADGLPAAGVWTRPHSHGHRPLFTMNHAAAGLPVGGGVPTSAPRLVLLAPGCAAEGNDDGPGSSAWVHPFSGPPTPADAAAESAVDGAPYPPPRGMAAADPWTWDSVAAAEGHHEEPRLRAAVSEALNAGGGGGGGIGVPLRPIATPQQLPEPLLRCLPHSRVYLHDSATGGWEAVTPTWELPWTAYTTASAANRFTPGRLLLLRGGLGPLRAPPPAAHAADAAAVPAGAADVDFDEGAWGDDGASVDGDLPVALAVEAGHEGEAARSSGAAVSGAAAGAGAGGAVQPQLPLPRVAAAAAEPVATDVWADPLEGWPMPPPRTAHSLTLLEEGLPPLAPAATATPASTASSAAVVTQRRWLHYVVFGGYSQLQLAKLGGCLPVPPPGRATQEVLLHDTWVLAVKEEAAATAAAGGRQTQPRRASFQWQRPRVTGVPPAARFSHTATTLPLPPDEGGPVVVVFGGSTGASPQNDIHLLVPDGADDDDEGASGGSGVSPPSAAPAGTPQELARHRRLRFRWEAPEVFGSPPAPRHSHAAASLFSTLTQGTEMAPAGGGDGGAHPPVLPPAARAAMHSDVTCRTLVVHGGHGLHRWRLGDVHVMTLVRVPLPLPSAASAAAAVAPPRHKYAVWWSSPLLVPGPRPVLPLCAREPTAAAAAGGSRSPHGVATAAAPAAGVASSVSSAAKGGVRHANAAPHAAAAAEFGAPVALPRPLADVAGVVGPSPREKHTLTYVPSWPAPQTLPLAAAAAVPSSATATAAPQQPPALRRSALVIGAQVPPAELAASALTSFVVPGGLLVFGGRDGGDREARNRWRQQQRWDLRAAALAEAALRRWRRYGGKVAPGSKWRHADRAALVAATRAAATAGATDGWRDPSAVAALDYQVRGAHDHLQQLDTIQASAVHAAVIMRMGFNDERRLAAERTARLHGAGDGADAMLLGHRSDVPDVDVDEEEGDGERRWRELEATEFGFGDGVGSDDSMSDDEDDDMDEDDHEDGGDDDDDADDHEEDFEDEDAAEAPGGVNADADDGHGHLADANAHVLRLRLAPYPHHLLPGGRYFYGGGSVGSAPAASSAAAADPLPAWVYRSLQPQGGAAVRDSSTTVDARALKSALRAPPGGVARPFLRPDPSASDMSADPVAGAAATGLYGCGAPVAHARGVDTLSDALAFKAALLRLVPPVDDDEYGRDGDGAQRDDYTRVHARLAQDAGFRRRLYAHVRMRDALRLCALRVVPVAAWEQPQAHRVSPWLGEPLPAVPESTAAAELGGALVVNGGDDNGGLGGCGGGDVVLAAAAEPPSDDEDDGGGTAVSTTVRTYRWLLARLSPVFAAMLRRLGAASEALVPRAGGGGGGGGDGGGDGYPVGLSPRTLRGLLHFMATDCLPRLDGGGGGGDDDSDDTGSAVHALLDLLAAACEFGVPRLAVLAEGALLGPRFRQLVLRRPHVMQLLELVDRHCPGSGASVGGDAGTSGGGGAAAGSSYDTRVAHQPSHGELPPGLLLRTSALAAAAAALSAEDVGATETDALAQGGDSTAADVTMHTGSCAPDFAELPPHLQAELRAAWRRAQAAKAPPSEPILPEPGAASAQAAGDLDVDAAAEAAAAANLQAALEALAGMEDDHEDDDE